MSKYAPVYMTAAYDGPEYTLADLTLSADEFTAGDAEDTAIGTLSGMADDTDSSIELTDDASGAVKLVGNELKVGATATAEAGTLTVKITETNSYGVETTHVTTLTITVNAAAGG